MGLGFQIDIYNNTSQTVQVSAVTPPNMNAGGFGNIILPPNTRLSSVGNKTPVYAELAGSTAALPINVLVTNQPGPPQGSYIVEFDSTRLVNFNGLVCFGSANDLASAVTLPSGNIIYATLYLGVWGQWTEGTLMLIETVGSLSLG
jgi:hypothetical protein